MVTMKLKMSLEIKGEIKAMKLKMSHEIKRCLLLGRIAMTHLDNILKSKDITLPTKARIVKAKSWT